MRYLLFLIVVAAILATCGGNGVLVFYEGERKTSSEVGTIEIGNNICVMSIDTLTRRYQPLSNQYIEVLPGPHKIGVNYMSSKGSSTEPILLPFNTESGHTYLVKVRGSANYWTAWIIDTATDSLVAGSDELTDVEHRGRLIRTF